MWKHTPLGVVCSQVPGRTCCGIKVIVPVLVKCIVGVVHCVDQTIMEHLGRSCNISDKVKTHKIVTPDRQPNGAQLAGKEIPPLLYTNNVKGVVFYPAFEHSTL